MRKFGRRRALGIGVLTAALAMTGLAAVTAAGAPAGPDARAVPTSVPVAADPVPVFFEDFESGQPPLGDADGVTMLDEYTGGPLALGMKYTADAIWIDEGQCNGVILSAAVLQPAGFCTPTGWGKLRELADALGDARTPPAPSETNHAVAAWTSTMATGADSLQLRTLNGIPVSPHHYYTTSIETAGVSCNVAHPAIKFYLLPDNDPDPMKQIATFTTPIDPCDGASSGTHVVNGVSNSPVLYDGTSLGIAMRNGTSASSGNDSAFDNISLLDVTPQLYKQFKSAGITPGGVSTLTLTIVNTSERGAKENFGFTDTLPTGLTVADPAEENSTCGDGEFTSNPSGTDLTLTGGDLAAGAESCVVTVNVTAENAGRYVNDPADVTLTGLLAPEPAELIVGAPFACPSSRFFLAQGAPTQLGTLTPGSSTFTPIGTKTATYNAIGFNESEHFLYAITSQKQVARIDSTGAIVELGEPTIGANTFNAGAVHPDGRYYFVMASDSSKLYRIDLYDPDYSDGLDTLEIQIKDGNVNAVPGAADLTFIGDDLWGEQANFDNFVRITLDNLGGTPATATRTVFPSAPTGVVNSKSGAAWTYANGNLGLSDNDKGDIHQVHIDNPTSMSPTFSLVATSTGPTSQNNDGAACTGQSVDLGIEKAAVPSPAIEGAPVTYTLTVTNHSATTDSSGYIVTDTAPAGLTDLRVISPGEPECTWVDHALTCTGAALPHGQSMQFVYTGTAPAAPSSLDNNATVTGNEDDPNALNNHAGITTAVTTPTPTPSPEPSRTPASAPGTAPPTSPPSPAAPPADLRVDVEAPPKVPTGGKITLQITVKNKGPGKSVRPVVKYTVPKGISSVRVAVPRHADCAFAGRTLTCTLPNLKSGKSLRITVTGTVDGSARTLRNTVTVVGKNDPRKGNNKDVTEIQVLAASRPRPAHQTAPKPTPKPSDQQACGGPMSRGYSVNRPSGDC